MNIYSKHTKYQKKKKKEKKKKKKGFFYRYLLQGATAPPNPKKLKNSVACFVLYLKIINIFLKNNNAYYSKLSKELKNSIKIKVDQAVLELLIQNEHFDCFDLIT